MSKKNFYGSSEKTAISYLEFGSLDLSANKKNIWDFKLHDKAYDWLMLSRYSNDMLTYIKMKEMLGHKPLKEIIELYKKEVHHKNDFSSSMGKLIGLIIMNSLNQTAKNISFFELGQTIFGCIEGIKFTQCLARNLNISFREVDLKKIEWLGVDISDYFNRLAKIMHQSYLVKTFDDINKINVPTDVFFAKGITLLYAVRNLEELFVIVSKGKIAIFDYSFSFSGNQEITLGTGKRIMYLDFKNFLDTYKKRTEKMFVRKNKSHIDKETNRIFLDCVYGEKKLCEEYIKFDKTMRNEFSLKFSNGDNSIFLDRTENEVNEWVRIEDIIDLIK